MLLKQSRVLGLVALACVAVITSHCYLTELSAWSASIFVIASGYFLSAAHYDDFSDGVGIKTAVCFAAGKLGKIFPLYILCIIAAFLPRLYFSLKGFSALDSEFMIGAFFNVFLLQAWTPVYVFTVNGVGWYFSVCVLLFALFPFILTFVRRIGTIRGCLAAAFAVTLVQLAVSCLSCRFLSAGDVKWFNLCFPPFRVFDFTVGVIIGHIIKGFPRPGKSPAAASAAELSAVFLTVLSIYIFYRIYLNTELNWIGYTLLFVAPTFALVLVFARGEGFVSAVIGNRFFRRLGLTGAASYIVHALVISNTISLAVRLGISTGVQHVLVPVASVVLSFLIGHIWALIRRKSPAAHTAG